MARIPHPRTLDRFERGPSSTVAVPVGGGRSAVRRVERGDVVVEDAYAEATMDALERAYDVEYDRDTGDLVGAEPVDDTTDGGDVDDDTTGEEAGETDTDATESTDDVEQWADWNADDWLSMGYKFRETDVLEGVVDDHLQEVYDVESSSTVRGAVEERAEEIGTLDELDLEGN